MTRLVLWVLEKLESRFSRSSCQSGKWFSEFLATVSHSNVEEWVWNWETCLIIGIPTYLPKAVSHRAWADCSYSTRQLSSTFATASIKSFFFLILPAALGRWQKIFHPCLSSRPVIFNIEKWLSSRLSQAMEVWILPKIWISILPLTIWARVFASLCLSSFYFFSKNTSPIGLGLV